MSVEDAYELAQQAVETQAGFTPGDRAMWSRELVGKQIALSHPLLWKDRKDNVWRYAWEVPTINSGGMTFRVVMNAATGEVLHLRPTTFGDRCTPASFSGESAVAQPQNPLISQRYVWATMGSAVGAPFTDDAHKVSTYGYPEEVVYHGTQVQACGNDYVYYEVLPLTRDEFNRPFYSGASGSTNPASAAGDAMWFTYQTMGTLMSLGRNGWDGSGGRAAVVVDAHGAYGLGDRSYFQSDPSNIAPLH